MKKYDFDALPMSDGEESLCWDKKSWRVISAAQE